MITEAEGIVLRQTKITGGRRMLVMLTDRYGKISAGTSQRERSRKRSDLAMRPFTHGRYELYKKGAYFNINSGEVVESYYDLGEDIDRYMHAGFCLELTDKILAENVPAPAVFHDLAGFLAAMNRRRKKFETLVVAYEIKVLRQLGYMPDLSSCVSCGSRKEPLYFSVESGGLLCRECLDKQAEEPEKRGKDVKDRLIYDSDFGIVNVVKFLERTPFAKLERLAMQEQLTTRIQAMMQAYIKYYFDIRAFRSESLQW